MPTPSELKRVASAAANVKPSMVKSMVIEIANAQAEDRLPDANNFEQPWDFRDLFFAASLWHSWQD